MASLHVFGIDFGTDSVRSVLVDASNGAIVADAVHEYSRWKKGLYCDPRVNRFRQHPLDYMEGLEASVKDCLFKSKVDLNTIRGICVDTTGSTPVAVDATGKPLSLTDDFKDNPNAMFVLWKDHTAIREAGEINELCKNYPVNYSKFVGGVYSSEWYWAKILHVLRADESIRNSAYTWVEHCDWIPFLLTGGDNADKILRSRCAAGHKAMWHEEFGGLPPNDFFKTLDPLLDGLRETFDRQTYTSDIAAGNLSPEWAQRLGLPESVIVSVGAFDAHIGAVGGEIEPYFLSKIIGTSTCDILIAPEEEMQGKLVDGICGQVNGSVIPGMLGMEAGQSAFGDVYAWFSKLISWPLENIPGSGISAREIGDKLIPALSEQAAKLPPDESSVVALDWLNGRRTPDADQTLKGAITGLSLSSDAPRIFRALVEATCFGSRKIVDRFIENGIRIDGIIALGGVAKKSPFIMQTLSDVLNRPIKVARSEQTCAHGSAMFAATAAGIYASVEEAKRSMGQGFEQIYRPDSSSAKIYDGLYKKYLSLADYIEGTKQK